MSSSFKSSSEVWKLPKVKKMLESPVGTPVDISDLSKEELKALVHQAQGAWANHPYIKDSVKWVRELRQGLSTEQSED